MVRKGIPVLNRTKKERGGCDSLHTGENKIMHATPGIVVVNLREFNKIMGEVGSIPGMNNFVNMG